MAERDKGIEKLASSLKRARQVEHAKIRRAQTRPAPGLPGRTMRDLANALVVATFRNGFIEDLHAGKWSPLTTDPGLSRITDDEMKKLMLEASARLAHLLHLLFEQPEEFRRRYDFLRAYTAEWEREEISFDLPPAADQVPKCSACHESISSNRWRFCPVCGLAYPAA